MKLRDLPVLPTLVVLAAVAVMVMLGAWQLQRAEWKDALIERFRTAQEQAAPIAWPAAPAQHDEALFRRSEVACVEVLDMDAVAGRSARGEAGWAHVARCRLAQGGGANVAIGWSQDPRARRWGGGTVSGFIAPAGRSIRLVAFPAEDGLQQLAKPDPNDLPNNHLAYAFQWFFFAGTALVIYGLALRRRRPRNGTASG